MVQGVLPINKLNLQDKISLDITLGGGGRNPERAEMITQKS